MPKNDLVYVGHMLDEARKLANRFADVDRATFDQDEDLQVIAVHRIQTIGEAARHVSVDFRSAHDEVSWSNIVGMRNRLVHDYLNVDLDIV